MRVTSEQVYKGTVVGGPWDGQVFAAGAPFFSTPVSGGKKFTYRFCTAAFADGYIGMWIEEPVGPDDFGNAMQRVFERYTQNPADATANVHVLHRQEFAHQVAKMLGVDRNVEAPDLEGFIIAEINDLNAELRSHGYEPDGRPLHRVYDTALDHKSIEHDSTIDSIENAIGVVRKSGEPIPPHVVRATTIVRAIRHERRRFEQEIEERKRAVAKVNANADEIDKWRERTKKLVIEIEKALGYGWPNFGTGRDDTDRRIEHALENLHKRVNPPPTGIGAEPEAAAKVVSQEPDLLALYNWLQERVARLEETVKDALPRPFA
jgi:hypothetical protein